MEFFQVTIMCDHYYLAMELQDGDATYLASLDEFKQARELFQDGDTVG